MSALELLPASLRCSFFNSYLRPSLKGWSRIFLFIFGVVTPLAAFPFDLQAHRGGRGLAPENTLAAFDRALQIGVSTLELDIGISADGVPVIHHDAALNPDITRDAQGQWLTGRGPLIKSMTLAQLQVFDVGLSNPASPYGQQFPTQQARDGQRIPTLAALFKRVKELGADQVQFDIETKIFPLEPGDTVAPETFVTALLGVIREAGMTQRVMIQSFDWRSLQLIQKMEPGMRTVYLTTPNRLRDGNWTAGMLLKNHASVAHMVKASGGVIWSPNFKNVDAAAVKVAQQLGLKVIPWTVNETGEMTQLLDIGVDGIITDYPDRLRELMRQRGLALPPTIQN